MLDPVEDRTEAAVALRQLRLALEQLSDLGLHQLLVQHLSVGDAVDLGAQCRDAVFVGLLQTRLAGRSSADEVVPEDKVGCGEQVAYRDGGEGGAEKGRQPGSDREVTDLIAARNDDRVGLSAFSEDGGLTCVFHQTALPYRVLGDRTHYTLLGLTKLCLSLGRCAGRKWARKCPGGWADLAYLQSGDWRGQVSSQIRMITGIGMPISQRSILRMLALPLDIELHPTMPARGEGSGRVAAATSP